MDVASLQVIIQTKGVDAAQRELDKLSGTAGKAEKSVGGLASSIKTLGTVATIGAVVSLGKEAVKMADSYKLVEARLSLVTKGTLELANAQQSLFNISQNTRQSFKETADLYASLARSTQQLGKTQTETLRVTETINKAIIISGASAQSAQAALVQLGQGFASGTLRGEELNSVLEQTPRIAEAIAKGMGVTIGQLRALGAEGSLTGEAVFEALQKQAKAVDEEFAKIPPTVGQATIQIGNSLTLLAGTLDKATGATDALARSFSDLSKTISDTALSMDVANKSVFSLKTADEFDKKTKLITDEINELRKALETDDGFLWFGLDERTTGEYQNRIKRLEQQLKQLGDTRDDVAKSLAPSLDDAMRAFQNSEKAYRSTFNPSKEEIEAEKRATRERISQAQKLAEDWSKRNIEITTNMAIAQQDELAKPFIVLEAKYKEDLETFKGVKGAKERLTLEYNAEVERQLKDLTEKFNKEEEAKAKKSAEWQVKMLEANEKYNDEIIKMRDEMYGTDTSIDAWYNNQLEYLGKLSQEAGATAEELQTLLDKIETLKSMKLQKQTISFKVEQSFYSSFENNLADSIEDAFNGTLNFKKFFKNIGNDLMKTFSSSLASVGTNMLRGNYSALAALGGASASLVGTSISAEDISGIMNSGGTFDSATNTITTSGGTKIALDAMGGGSVSSTGSDIMSLVNTVSTLKTAYTVATAGLSASIQSGFVGLGGMTGIGGIGEFGAGFANPFAYSGTTGLPTAMGAGSVASGALLGGAVGYGAGALGDAAFGANTYASTTGAIGGAAAGGLYAAGMISGPVGWAVLGASLLLGGLFGKKEVTDVGYQFFDNMTSLDEITTDTVKQYSDWKKKSWFSSKSGTDYSNLSSKEMKQIESVFDTYDYLLGQLGDTDKIWLDAGKYTGATFVDALSKNFISAFTDVNQNNDATFYQAWVDYAESIDKTVMEAFTSSIGSFIQSKRTFEVWALGDSIEALAKKSEFATADLNQIKDTLGATGTTVESFLSDFDKAVKENFTPETITQWESLGSALMTATDAQAAYQTALEQFIKASNDFISNFDIWSANSSGNTIEGLKIKADYLQSSFIELEKSMGLSGITVDNFKSTYESLAYVYSGFGRYRLDTEMATQLQSLGNALMTATDAQKAYQTALSANSNSILQIMADMYSATNVQPTLLELQTAFDSITGMGIVETIDEFYNVASGLMLLSPTNAQVLALSNLGDALLSVYENARDAEIALNAQLTSNADSFVESLLGADNLFIQLARTLGVTIPTTMEELMSMTTRFSLSGGGIDNSELSFLQQSLDRINTATQQNEQDRLDALNAENERLASIATQRQGLQDTYDVLTNVITQRDLELRSIDETNVSLQQSIWLEQDRLDALNAENARLEALRQTSQSNIDSFSKSLMTQEQIATRLADSLGVDLANNVNDLARLFNRLKDDTDGLTNEDLELLNINKEMLLNTDSLNSELTNLNNTFSNIENNISLLDGIVSSLDSTIESLRSSATSSSSSLSLFYHAMNESKNMIISGNYENFEESIAKTIELSSALMDTKNFESYRDMQFAQLISANNFEDLKDVTLTEIDYLKQIEENTSNQIATVEGSINNLSSSLNSLLSNLINGTPLASSSSVSSSSVSSTPVNNTEYDPYANITTTDSLGIVHTSMSPMAIQRMYANIYAPYNEALQAMGIPFEEGHEYLTINGVRSNFGINNPKMLMGLIENGTILGYSNGGYTGNLGIQDIAGVVHGQEYVVNAQTTKDLGLNGSGGAFADMVAELASLRKLMVKLVSDNTKQLSTQRAILGEKVAI